MYSNGGAVNTTLGAGVFKGQIFSLGGNRWDRDLECVVSEYLDGDVNYFLKQEGSLSGAVFDENRLVMYRTNIATTTIYYFINNDEIIISSNLQYFSNFNIDMELNREWIAGFLIKNQVNDGTSILNNVKQLKPGQRIIYDRRSHAFKEDVMEEQYKVFSLNNGTDEERLDTLDRILNKQIDDYVTTEFDDRKIYNLLSGGNDSSLLQAISNKTHPLDSICANFGDTGEDSQYSQTVADYLNCGHEVFNISKDSFSGNLKTAISLADSPTVFDGELMFFDMFSRFHANKPTENVCFLDGNGADRVMAGRKPLIYLPIINKYSGLIENLTKISNKIFSNHSALAIESIARGLKKRDYGLDFYIGFFNWIEIAQVIKKAMDIDDMSFIAEHDLEELQKYPGDIQEKLYRLNLYHGSGIHATNFVNYALAASNNIILLHPFLTNEIKNFFMSIPVREKLKKGIEKYYGRKLLERYMPKNLIYREKIYKNVPWIELFNEKNHLGEYVEEIKQTGFEFCNFDYNKLFLDPGMTVIGKKLINLNIYIKLLNSEKTIDSVKADIE
jgi:asparagine synthase (glutamine-hydrolysing)